MDTDQEQTAPEADTTDTGAPAQTVRVPNVSPGAKSGLDHIVIGSDALAPTDDDEQALADEEDHGEPEVPDDAAEALTWVQAAEDSDTAQERADLVWAKHGPDSELATALRAAAHGDDDPDDTVTDPPPA